MKLSLLFPATVPPTAGFAGQADIFSFRDEGRKEAMRFFKKIIWFDNQTKKSKI